MNRRQTAQHKTLNKLVEFLKNNSIASLSDREIFHPEEGYAQRIVNEFGLKGVQLRRFYSEFKHIYENVKKQEHMSNEVMYRFYRLYALVNYQANRGVIKYEFKDLLIAILNNIERKAKFDKKAIERAVDLLMAMVAYSKKEN